MRRREFITFVGGTAVVASPLARAEATAVPVIGFLNGTNPAGLGAYVAAFQRGLGEIGYVEGQNVAIEYRWAEGQYGRLPDLASDLIGRRVAVIVTSGGGDTVALAAKRATTAVPIVFLSGGDPVKSGLVASLNRPGGNVTGVALLTTELEAKRLEMLHELVPSAKTIAFLFDPHSASAEADERAKLLTSAATRMGLQIIVLTVSSAAEIDLAFASLAQRRAGAVLLGGAAVFDSRRDQVVSLAAHLGIPVLFDTRIYVTVGGLASYGPDVAAGYREVGAYTGRILRGAKPTDLPVLQLSKIEFVINLKTAKALGLAISQSLLAAADEVIE